MAENPYRSPLEYNGVPSALRPVWVTVGLWGCKSRRSAMAFLWLSILTTVVSVAIAFRYPVAWFGTLFLLSAAWYGASIHWVDRYDHW